eukprot:SAG25_NODE_330_length_9688_cov_5.158202_8_plen_208_part_00
MTPSLQEDTEEPLAQRPTAAHQEASVTADRKRRLSPPPPAAVQVQTSSSSSRSDPLPQKRRCLVDQPDSSYSLGRTSYSSCCLLAAYPSYSSQSCVAITDSHLDRPPRQFPLAVRPHLVQYLSPRRLCHPRRRVAAGVYCLVAQDMSDPFVPGVRARRPPGPRVSQYVPRVFIFILPCTRGASSHAVTSRAIGTGSSASEHAPWTGF